MRKILFLASLALVAACKQETTFETREARLAVNPPLLDLGDVAVGSEVTGILEVDHLDGIDATIRNVSVVNLAGDAFRYDGPDSIEVPRETRIEVPILFAPTEAGWFSARVTITHTGIDSPVDVDVRGHGVFAEASLSPLALDFGAVDPGETASRDVTLSNDGLVDLVVSAMQTSNPVAFTVGIAAPQTVSAGGSLTIPIRFSPTDLQRATANFTVTIGSVGLPVVSLRGNDCEGGLPEAYDVDQDGFTSCGGDCDDDDGSIHPGTVEVADGADQDCNGLVDDKTDAYDDDGDGLSEQAGDCNDGLDTVSPNEPETVGNGIDDDCDGVVDLGSADLDLDGYDPTIGGDCDDSDPNVHPGAVELVNSDDDDCDGLDDEGTTAYDDDGDGYCEAACTDGSMPGDCDDTSPATRAGAVEVPDGQDNDCDGPVDENTTNFDDDGDGYTEVGGDCDDTDPTQSPGLGTCP